MIILLARDFDVVVRLTSPLDIVNTSWNRRGATEPLRVLLESGCGASASREKLQILGGFVRRFLQALGGYPIKEVIGHGRISATYP